MSREKGPVTGSLEDYLETIFRIQGSSSVARVRDIADEMDVSPASVTPAMKRLAQLDLIRYSKRNYIELTEKGLNVARRTMTRHNLLSRFLFDILGADRDQAEEEACAMEHHLSDSSVERLAAFFEFLAACPELRGILDRGFGNCLEGMDTPAARCSKAVCPLMKDDPVADAPDLSSLAALNPGDRRSVARITGTGDIRRQLIDLGFIQGSQVTLKRPGGKSLSCVVSLDGHDLELPQDTARCVLVHPVDAGKGAAS